MISFPSSRAAAWARWQEFIPQVTHYGQARNHVAPGHEKVSHLSPALRARLITEEELIAEVRKIATFPRVEKFVQEILWRGYWKAWLEERPHVWSAYRRRVEKKRNRLDAATQARMAAVQRGESGVAVMDRFARELTETGYLHNHARMWWASFWVHVERLPWELGADFFYQHLLDADPASNTLSWRWVAGLQTKGKAYLVRRTNLEKYVAKVWLDVPGLERLDDDRVQTCVPVEDDISTDAVPPVVSDVLPPGADWGLWLHGEDVSPESAPWPDHAPRSIRAFLAEDLASAYQISALRRNYMQEALRDGLHRAAAHWPNAEVALEPEKTGALPQTMAAWVKEKKFSAVVMMRPFVGPLWEQLPALRQAVHAAGAKLVFITRPWDERLRPHARGGYFAFWEKMVGEIKW